MRKRRTILLICKHCKKTEKTGKKNKKFCSTACRLDFNLGIHSPRQVMEYEIKAKDEKIKKIEEIKKINCTCCGCGHKFDENDEKALLMIFERAHIHSKDCEKRKKEEVFLACRFCNAAQSKTCGYWEAPQKFIATCR